MFLDNLSASILRLCGIYDLSYEAASEQCDLSSRYFGDIVRRRTAPTIITLEKLCTGFHATPNDLLIDQRFQEELMFRRPMQISHVRCFRCEQGFYTFPVCPHCGMTMEREYQVYCDRCGQRLSWEEFEKAAILMPKR